MITVTAVLRAVHIVCGVYWAGTIFFMATLLQPSVADAGPEGGKVMRSLMRRRFFEILPAMAIITILSGIELFRRVSGGFAAGWFASRPGLSLTIGAVAGLVAFTIGMAVMRPAAKRVGPLAESVQQMPQGADRDARLAEVQRLRRRAAFVGRVAAVLLAIAVVLMATWRYV